MMSTKQLHDGLAAAIKRSMDYDEIVSSTVDSIDDAIADLNTQWDGDIDYCENAGSDEYGRKYTDVWGSDDDTAEGDVEWRLYLWEKEA